MSYSFINPAKINLHNKLSCASIYQQNTGLFNNVNTGVFDFIVLTNKSETENDNAIGVSVGFENEGKYIARNRIRLKYCKIIQLQKNWNLVFGCGLGFFNFGIQNSTTGAGKSIFMPDGNAGIILNYQKKWWMGLSAENIFNNYSSLIIENFQLKRIYFLTSGGEFKVNKHFNFNYSVLAEMNVNPNNSQIQIGSLYNEKFGISFGYKLNGSIVFMMSVKNHRLNDNGIFSYHVAYSVPSFSSYQISSYAELSIDYLFH